MSRTTNLLICIRRIMKLHETMLKIICQKYGLTLIEANIISFLCFNPGKDTAGDIVELKMLSKGNVSKAVESLIQKQLLQRYPDTRDRRKIHLFLLPKAESIIEDLHKLQTEFKNLLFVGFSEEERMLFYHLSNRMMENAELAMKGRDKNEPNRG